MSIGGKRSVGEELAIRQQRCCDNLENYAPRNLHPHRETLAK